MPTVAVPQIEVADLDVYENLSTICDRATALDPDVDLALFPEYGLTGFVADERAAEVALDRNGPELTRIEDVAATADVAIVVGFLEANPSPSGTISDERDGADTHRTDPSSSPPLYNALAYVDPDGTRTVYRKRHLWDHESDIVNCGDRLVTVETPIGTAGLVTCYDLNFVEDSAAFTDRGVDALLVAGAWPAAYSDNWRLLLRARALDGVRWVVGACRTGRGTLPDAESTVYAGRSAVVRPDGTVTASLGRDERDLVAALDPDVLAEQREEIPVCENQLGTRGEKERGKTKSASDRG